MLTLKLLFCTVGAAGAIGVCCFNHITNSSQSVKLSEGDGCCAVPPDMTNSERVISTTVAFSIQGMTCSRCVDSVLKVLTNMEGVKDVSVSMEHAEALVRFDTTNTPAVSKLIQEIEKSGLPRHNFVAQQLTREESKLWQQSQPQVTILTQSIKPLVDHFNDSTGKPRFVALLSSTCPYCVRGAEAIQKTILDAYPDEDISVSLVWIDMFSGDGVDSVNLISANYTDPRITHYYDVNHLAGNTISKALLYKDAGPAWDIYLFFDTDSQWTDVLPKPIEWTHQLSGGKRADPKRFRTGDDLVQQLRVNAEAMIRLKTTQLPSSVTLYIDGMTCTGCESAVQSALLKVPGVASADVSFEAKKAEIKLESTTKLQSVQTLIDAIKLAGFQANERKSGDG